MSLSVSGLPKPVNLRNDVRHNWEVMQTVYKLYNEQKFTDILFEFPNTTYKFTAHRLILAAASPYFLELFDNADDDCNSLTVTKMDSDTFEELVVYCYNGQTDITAGNAERMAKGAMLLRLYEVVDICVNYMMDHISDFLVRKLIPLATELEYEKFETRLLAYIVKNFKEVNRNGEIFDLNMTQWKFIIKELDVNVASQADIFLAIKGWYEYNATERQQYLPDLIGSLTLTEFDNDFLRQQIKPLSGCEGLATEALKKRGELPSWVAVQNWGEDWTGYKDILLYNQAKVEWVKATRLEIKRYYFSTAFMGNSLYFIGGRSRDGVSKAVLSYNLLTKKITTMPSLQAKRTAACVAVVNNSIYVFGGKADNPLTSVECYSTSAGRWEYKSGMPTPRAAAGVAILNANIYLIGGKDLRTLNRVDVYNVSTNRWHNCSPMAEARESPAVTVHQGLIYAMSGRFSDLKTVERYDPKQDKWTKIASLNVARRYICAASIGDQLWAFGGVIGPAQWDDTVEVYDEASDKWLVKKKLPVTGKFDCVTLPTNLADNLN
ncbi:kelch-like protein 5 [Bactrocera neohumeralis]|uniref:kelch-like protein 5 n=1 Tax=Bactrocera neohumeralis TaxID=98809 RepID=UPI0021661099|nr:kelch-like protein 5 [Bactrocera neohumeralis]